MSQKMSSDDVQKGFAVGRGLLAAAETLNFSMSDAHSDPFKSSSQSHLGMSGLGGGDGKEHDSQMPHRAGTHISNTMKLFASLGLSPSDLDALAQIPEENISVETLPHLIMQLKNRKMDSGRRMGGDLSSLSSESSYRGGREDWSDQHDGRLGSGVQTQSRSDFGYTSMGESSSRGFDLLGYGGSGGRDFSELSRDSYRSLGMSKSSISDDMFGQRRMGSPSQGKVQDFLGVMPLMFPHVCSLCDFEVLSALEWTQHTTGIRHSENRRTLLQLYPDWDPRMPSNRMSSTLSLDFKSRGDGLLGAAPVGAGLHRTGMSSNWGNDSSMGMSNKTGSYATAPKIRSRVVVAKYERKPVSPNNLLGLAKPFGKVCEHLILKKKAFLELQTHEEALAMVNYYQCKPAIFQGQEIQIYMSKELYHIEKDGWGDRDPRPGKRVSQVVFFSNLPRGGEKKMELLTVARRFGTVEKHLFLNDEAFVQMSNAEDAEMLVKYHTLHPLIINKRSVRLNICTKYQRLTVPPGKGDQPRRSSSCNSSSSSRNTEKSASKSQKSSASKAKASSPEVQSSKPEDAEDTKEDASGDEETVMAARDGDEEGFDEDPSTQDVNLSCDAEETETQKSDIDVIAPTEGPEAEPDDASDTENKEMPSDAGHTQIPPEDLESTAVQQEETAELPEEQKDDQPNIDEQDHDGETTHKEVSADFPENLDEFVTLDELEEEDGERLASQSKAKKSAECQKDKGGLRVVNVVGFKRGYGYLDDILALAKPFGKVVRQLILDVRPEAFLQFSTEEEAKAMANFYNSNVIPSVCGKAVKVYHSLSYATIQSGRVVYVGNLPAWKFADASLLKIAEPFGKVRKYFLNQLRNECFIEMESGEDAEKMAEAYKEKRPKFEGKRLLVYISRKYKQLKHGHAPSQEPEVKVPAKRERSEEPEAQSSSSASVNDDTDDKPSTKKLKLEEPVTDQPEEDASQEKKENQSVTDETISDLKLIKEKEPEVQPMETAASVSATTEMEKSVETAEKASTSEQTEKKPGTSLATLEPYDPKVPVGVEFVKMGYYCRVCFLFYSNEDSAKKVHCSSQTHYDKLKKHLEKEKAKAQTNGAKKRV